ncbi:TAP-like protein-domain-containing protein [Roridomyces roridus]|uniref:TAP-like protein-domain-containing protein n=1 Tax=Roridomyces roridus TaxID=1738132 RepID=A0AAD7BC85_9AGAR|nr:TAP-like protein-domain-containing protein [Roridomyces roridus]
MLRQARLSSRYLVLLLTPWPLLSTASAPDASKAAALNSDEFSWHKIAPSDELVWHDCYSGHQCARLKVPLDYENPDGASAAIAMRRIHSVVPHDSPEYRGPILASPGGPGASGVDFIQQFGHKISVIVGPEFDIVGCDPRGISRSTPRASFFEDRAERNLFWSTSGNSITASSSDDALARMWAQSMLVGRLAGERDDGNLRFIHSDYTARDMLRIVEAHGREKIQYWGFSYGSVLGATFAAMFPDKVGRLVIDGVVDSENYYAAECSNNLMDTEKVWTAFLNGCVDAGPTKCPIYSPTAAEIQATVDDLYDSLRKRPIPVRTATSYGIVDYDLMRNTIFVSLYKPFALFPTLARALADLSAGNATGLYQISEAPQFKCSCDLDEFSFENVNDGGLAVLCNDGKRISKSFEDAEKHYRNLLANSSWADVWMSACDRLACMAWPEFPKTNFHGPFVANTSFPLLMVGNTADPVTPLWAAKKMAQGFSGSVVLTQDSIGHCSLAAPSLCTQKHIRNYFRDGVLPEAGTVCSTDSGPFDALLEGQGVEGGGEEAQVVLGGFSAEDRTLLEAVQGLARAWDVPLGM